MAIDLLIEHATQLVTCASPGGPKRGEALVDVGLILDGAVAVAGGKIVAVGRTTDLRADYTARQTIDASGKVVCPGFVDPHTHVVYAGDRAGEVIPLKRGITRIGALPENDVVINSSDVSRNHAEIHTIGRRVPPEGRQGNPGARQKD